MGRPKKSESVKPGQLKSGRIRYTFIANDAQIKQLKDYSKREQMTMAQLMEEVIKHFLKRNKSFRRNQKSRKINEEILKSYLEIKPKAAEIN